MKNEDENPEMIAQEPVPAETNPAEELPAETNPAEAHPEEESPAEAVPAEASPAEESSATVQEADVPVRSKKRKILIPIAVVLLVLAVTLFVIFGVPALKYSSAVAAFDAGEYAAAVEGFTELDDYKDSQEYLAQAKLGVFYVDAEAKLAEGDYTGAIESFRNAGTFQDAKGRIPATYELYGDSLFASGRYDEAVKAYTSSHSTDKITQCYNSKGEKLFGEKLYMDAAEAFAAADNIAKRIDCGKALAEEGNYADAVSLLDGQEDAEAVRYLNYSNAKLSMAEMDYQSAIHYFNACDSLMDADMLLEESTFLLAEDCLHEGYLNKAKNLYESLPEGYTRNDVSAAQRIELLSQNQDLLNLVGVYRATDVYYKAQADSTTSSYYYYWYQDSYTVGNVSVTCPYNDDGTFNIVGTATFPCYQNFSTKGSEMKTDMETYSFTCSGNKIPYQIGSNRTTTLTYSGGQFRLNYKYVNDWSNLYWSYTYTCKATYAGRTMLAQDQ